MTLLRWLVLWLFGLLPLATAAQGAGLLWITSDVTPPAKSAMVQRLAAESGFAVRHLEYPVAGPAQLAPEAARELQQALGAARWIWIDAPHASLHARLKTQLGPWLTPELGPRVVWIGPAQATADVVRDSLAAYVQAGGESNLRHAMQLARAVADGQPPPALPQPQQWPARGLYHPDAPGLLADARALEQWRRAQPALQALPPVALLVHRYHFVHGSTDWLDTWLRMFQRRGLLAYAVFGARLDAAEMRQLLEAEPGRAHPRALVLHQLLPQGAALQPLLQAWDVPLLATHPYRAGGIAEWERDTVGLQLADVPFYLAQPEVAGAIDPLPVVAHADGGKRAELIVRQAEAVIGKARRMLALRERPAKDKRLVAMVYNYPPGGSNFGASFLNVPRSLQQVSGALAQAGYVTREVAEQDWIAGLAPLLAAYYPGADLRALLAAGQAEAFPLVRYRQMLEKFPSAVRQRIEARWGAPERSRYVVEWQGELVFVVPRLQVGQLAVLPQPPREETQYHGRNPFVHRTLVPPSHHYLAVYFWAQEADALIHFGTHGTQEWAGGKARGLDVWDDALLPLGDLPVIYPYIVDNLGEALTAKRRGRATLVSHRTPVLAPAGFSERMAHMHELMHQWETLAPGPTRQALEKQLVAQFVEQRLDRDLGWSAARIASNFEAFLEQLHPYLDALAQSAQPRGLAVFGRVPEPALRRQLVLQALGQPLIEALGEDIDEAFLIAHDAVGASRPARWLDAALRDAEAASRLDLRPPEPAGHVPNRAARQPIASAALLALARRAQQLESLLATEGELPGLLAALEGRFVPAAYGGDPIRNPDSLPTGRNLAGLDPSRLPTRQAYAVAQTLFDDWLKQWQGGHGGAMPQRMALSLWAGETLRHQGIMEAQAMVALGVRPRWDDSGRPVDVEVIPQAQLGRPRVDVLLSVTGSYRDQFPSLMALLDQAVAAASEAEPDNVVVRQTAQVAAQLRQRGVDPRLAQSLAQARIFGNAPGDYGTGVADAVQDERLRRDDARLGELFLQRMSQPYLGGQPLAQVPAGAAAQALGAHLRATDAAVLSRSSHLWGMLTSDDPFQYLGGLAAAARSAGRREPLPMYVNQLQDAANTSTVGAQRSIALELQARYLHPGWLQAQKAEGYAGTLQVLKAVQFAWGWQAVAPDMVRPDHWQRFYELLVKDAHGLGVPQWLRSHPQAYAQTLERLVQAQRLGHWQPDAAAQREVARLYRELTRGAPLARELASVRRWVDGQLAPAQPAPAQPQPREAAPPPAPPTGWVLRPQPVPPAAADRSDALLRGLAGLWMLGLMGAGGAWQLLRRRPQPVIG